MRSRGRVAAGLLTALVLVPLGVALGVEPERPRVFVDTSYFAPTGRTLAVAGGGDFQAALDEAAPGDVITLEAGASFTGNFTLPRKAGDGWIVVRTSAPDSALPAPGTRITPAYASVLPKVVSPNDAPALTADSGVHHYRFIGVEFTVTDGVSINFNLILLGNRPATLDEVPHDLIFDRVYVHGNPSGNIRRGIAMNGASIAVIDSHISDFHEMVNDSQAIAGWDGPGPFKIVNNYLEGAGENLMFGGADPATWAGCDPAVPATYINCLVPSDIEIRRNHFFKPLTWKADDPSYAGLDWAIKNLLELKNAQRVLIDANVFEHTWADAQGGTAILFTVRNQGGTAPWSVVQDVTFTNNIVRHAGTGIGMHGQDSPNVSQPTKRILIRNNLFDDISTVRWHGFGRLFMASGPIADLVIDHNTGFMDQAIMMADIQPHTGFVYTNNLSPVGIFGFTGAGAIQGTHALDVYFPGGVFERNLLVGADPSLYPTDNFFPLSLTDVGFVNLNKGNYRLKGSSAYSKSGTDGEDIGADIRTIIPAVEGVAPPSQ